MLVLLMTLTACSSNALSDDKLDDDQIGEVESDEKEVSSVEDDKANKENSNEEEVDSSNEEDPIVSEEDKSNPDKSPEKETTDLDTSKEEGMLVSNGTEKPKPTTPVADKEVKPVVPPVSKPKPPVEKPKPTPTPKPEPNPEPKPEPKPDPKPEPKPEPTPPPVEIPDYSDPEGWDEKASLALTKRINEVRVQKGYLEHITGNANLIANAKKRAKDIVSDYSHNGSIYGEVLWKDWGSPNVEKAVQTWIDSPGQNKVIFRESVSMIHFSVYESGGLTYYAGVFGWAE